MLPHATGSGEEALAWLREGRSFAVALWVCQDHAANELDLVAALRGLRPAAMLPLVVIMPAAASAAGLGAVASSAQALLRGPLRLPQLYAVLLDLVAPSDAAGAQPADLGVTPPLDGATLGQVRTKLSGFSPAAFAILAQSFLEESPRLIALMSAAAVQGDGAELAQLAHRLKSSSAMLMATRLSWLCEDLEHTASAGSSEDWRIAVAQIEAEFADVRAMLSAQRNPTGSAP